MYLHVFPSVEGELGSYGVRMMAYISGHGSVGTSPAANWVGIYCFSPHAGCYSTASTRYTNRSHPMLCCTMNQQPCPSENRLGRQLSPEAARLVTFFRTRRVRCDSGPRGQGRRVVVNNGRGKHKGAGQRFLFRHSTRPATLRRHTDVPRSGTDCDSDPIQRCFAFQSRRPEAGDCQPPSSVSEGVIMHQKAPARRAQTPPMRDSPSHKMPSS